MKPPPIGNPAAGPEPGGRYKRADQTPKSETAVVLR